MAKKCGFRQAGIRKYKLLMKIKKELQDMGKRGINGIALMKFLKIKLPLERFQNTKQLSGVLSTIKQFNK